jgi:hypothetical protein
LCAFEKKLDEPDRFVARAGAFRRLLESKEFFKLINDDKQVVRWGECERS